MIFERKEEKKTILTPNEFFDLVVKEKHHTVIKLVGRVIYHTVGRGHAEWWFTTPGQIRVETGMSHASLHTALAQARSKGYLIHGVPDDGDHTIALRLRWQGEPADTSRVLGLAKTPAGFVYLLHRPLDGLYKIGRSNDPERRVREIETAAAAKTYLVHKAYCDHPAAAESDLHQRYADFRATGLWFDLPDDAVEEIKALARYTSGRWVSVDISGLYHG